MGMRVTSCLGCCTLRTGALVIAILQLIASFGTILLSAIGLGLLKHYEHEQKDRWTDVLTTPRYYFDNEQTKPSSNADFDEFASFGIVVLAILIGVNCINLLFHSLLLIGIVQSKTNLLMAWVVFSAICVGLDILSAIGACFVPNPWILVKLVSIPLQIYYIVVIRSFHDSLRNPQYDVIPIAQTENGNMNVTITTTAPPQYPTEETYPYCGPTSQPPPYAMKSVYAHA